MHFSPNSLLTHSVLSGALLLAACEHLESDSSPAGSLGMDGRAQLDGSAALDGQIDEDSSTTPSSVVGHTMLGIDASSARSRPNSTRGQIEAVGMDLYNRVGADGLVYPEPIPVLFFTGGAACLDINYVAQPDDLETHRTKSPQRWTEWRREGDRRALLKGGRWKYVYYRLEYLPLPREYGLDGVFTFTIGASTSVSASLIEKTYGFSRDQRFTEGQFAGFASQSVVTSSAPPEHRGSYEIDGYLLRLRYDDGTSKELSLVYSEADPDVLWIAGRGFVRDE